jgi:hypothetical protein
MNSIHFPLVAVFLCGSFVSADETASALDMDKNQATELKNFVYSWTNEPAIKTETK